MSIMSDHTHELRSPILKAERIKFAIYQALGAGQHEWVYFDREVIWLRDESTTWRASLGGQVMKEGATHNGFYGPGTSSREMIDEAADWFGRFPQMEVEVVTTLETLPALRAKTEAFYESAVKYHPLPGWFLADAALEAWIAAGMEGWYGEHGVTRPEGKKECTPVWRNGAMTFEGVALRDRLAVDRAEMTRARDAAREAKARAS